MIAFASISRAVVTWALSIAVCSAASGSRKEADKFIAACGLGPDLLDASLDWAAFEARLSGRRGMIKAALMDQTLFAGAGNVFSDEILYRAALHPRRRLEALTETERKRLFRAAKWVLSAAIKRRLASETSVKTAAR